MKKADFIGTFKEDKKIQEQFSGSLDGYNISPQLAYNTECLHVQENSKELWLWGRLYGIKDLAARFSIQFSNEADFLLRFFLKEGISAMRYLDGEFTFILKEESRTFVCRDRHGAGPQFFYSDDFFSSNLFAFRDFKDFSLEPDYHALTTFLSIGYIPSPQSSLKGVQKLPAGSYLIFKDGLAEVHDLYSFQEFMSAVGTCKLSIQDATDEYESLHKAAIEARIEGKTSVGLLMSGGYDSGGNIGKLRDVYSGDVSTFSIGFKDNPWTELPLAKLLAERFGAKHKEYEIDGSEIFDLPQIVAHIGDPFQEGGLMVNYKAMGLIGDKKPDIILGGDGNDQHHGTSGKELALHFKLKQKGLQPFQKMVSAMSGMPLFNKDNKFFRIKFHNEKILNILKSDVFGFTSSQMKNILAPGIQVGKPLYLNHLPKSYNGFDEFYFIHNYFGDIKQVINEVILFKASKMASLYDNALSFPYMSTDLYNFLMTLPRELKCKGTVDEMSKGKGVTKFLHKNYLKPKLPKEITERKKQGGFAPLPIFFRDEANRKQIADFILNSTASNELFNRPAIQEFIEDYNKGLAAGSYWFWYSQVKATQYFNLLSLTVWWEMMMNGKKGENLESIW
ncbi:MAG: asparagine synthetase B family protein [Bacteroidales bacterium]|nr:asparagine synthetase B family protein [Bacteroidales bacterium]MCF8455593.1 asparagine synthetase B family protein [Bacteroidales bacterium]